MKTMKMIKVGVLALTSLTILAGCGGAKNDKVAQDAVHTAIVNSSNVKSENYSLILDGKVTAGKDSTAQFKELKGSLNFSGAYDIKTKDDPKLTLKIGAKGTVDGGKEQSVGGEIVLANKNFYFLIGKLDVDGIPDLYKVAVDQFLNKWWSVALPPESLAQFNAGAADDANLTPEQKQLKELMKKTQFFKNVKAAGADKVGDVEAEKYSVELDKEALKTYLTEAAKISGQSAEGGDLEQVTKLVNTVEFKGSVWVSKDDQMMRKLDGTMTIAESPETAGSAISFQATYMVDNLNKAVKVEAPAKSEKFDLSKIMGIPAAPVAPAAPVVPVK